MEQYDRYQEVLRWIEAQEQKLHAQKLQRDAAKRDTDETEVAFQHLAEQKEWLLEKMKRRKEIADVEQAKRIEAGEEESRVDITMDTSSLDYPVIEEQGQFPKVLTPEEKKVYAHLVMVEVNQIQWRYKALTYLSLLLAGNKSTQQEGKED